MFLHLGRWVSRHPWAILLAWVGVVGLLTASAPSPEAVASAEPPSLLPDHQPYNQALEVARQAFPQTVARTRTVLIFERAEGLHTSDLDFVMEVTSRLLAEAGGRWRVLAPATHPHLQSRLVARDGQAVMIVVNMDSNYLVKTSVDQVEAVDALARRGLPDGLRLEITGEGGLGRELSFATTHAYHRTTWVTVGAVLTILICVYRAPLAAFVPLISIGASVYVALALLNRLAVAGWGVSNLERTFVVVLMFGSGTDYAMFWLARYREQSRGGIGSGAAAAATEGTGGAVAASAATTVIGLSMLLLAELSPTHNAGRALGLAIAVSMAAALTLVPAVARLMGSRLFWPRLLSAAGAETPSRLWGRLARAVVRYPSHILMGMAVLLFYPAWQGSRTPYRYDALGVVNSDSSAARGQELAERHFSAEELFSWTFVLSGGTECSPAALDAYAAGLAEACRAVDGVVDVWGLDNPFGSRGSTPLLPLAWIRPYYVNDGFCSVRVEVMQPFPPLSDPAMDLCSRLTRSVEEWARRSAGADVRLHAVGLTPYILNIKALSDADQRRIMVSVAAAIGVVVLIWVRRVGLTLVMVIATLVLYLTTLAVTDWTFRVWLDGQALDWKVKLFLFVIMMAVGQDYNIFLVSRILQERRSRPAPEATLRGIVTTGPVISSCGLIMAATLGSIAATGLAFYQQLGFAFALGILLDTFVIRPIVVPACYLVGEGLRRKRLDLGDSAS
jgi:RND superfamily putative drug exporter